MYDIIFICLPAAYWIILIVFSDKLLVTKIPFEMKLTLFIKLFFFLRWDRSIWHLTVVPNGHGGYDWNNAFYDEVTPHFSLDVTPAFAKVPVIGNVLKQVVRPTYLLLKYMPTKL